RDLLVADGRSLVSATACPAVSVCPVGMRKTSSGVGRRRARSVRAIRATSSSRTISARCLAPWVTGRTRRRSPASTCTSPAAYGRSAARAASRSLARMRVDLQAFSPKLCLEGISGAPGNHTPVVDPYDLVRQMVGLLQVLGGEKHRGACPGLFLDE